MAEATLNREYAVRILGIGALMVGMCVWSLYDGMVGWPRCNSDMEQVRPALLATNLTAEAWLERGASGSSPIDDAFASKGRPAPAKLIKKLGELKVPESSPDRAAVSAALAPRVTKVLESPVYSAHDLQTQFVQAAITLALGLCAFLVIGLRSRKRYVADEKGLSGSGVGGRTVLYDELASVDWSKWDEKGIAVLVLKSGARHTLDGWHYAGMTGILAMVEKQRPDLSQKAS